MKRLFLAAFSLLFLFSSCGSGPEKGKNDSAGKDSATAAVDPEKPHPVRKGKADYAFRPDTNVNSLALGNADSFKVFKRVNGFTPVSLGGDRYGALYINNQYADNHAKPNEFFEVRVTNDKKGNEVPYAFTLQSIDKNEHAPKFCTDRPMQGEAFTFVSGFGVYPGMSYQDILSVYKNQELMEWEKGDTVYLQYKPKPKDYGFYKRYKPESYSVTFKFKDEVLRRIEFYVDPAEFENKK